MKPQIDVVRCYIEHPDYFQGAGADIFVGMGDTALEALDDALGFCAMTSIDSEGKALPADLEWPSVPEQEQLLREAHCDLGYSISGDPDYASACATPEAQRGDDYNTPSVYLLIKVYV